MITAKPIINEKFWILEEDGQKVGTLRKQENNKFMLSSKNGDRQFNKKDELTKLFGKSFFLPASITDIIKDSEIRDVCGFPTSCFPHNPIYNIQKKLPLFTKSKSSKSLYCAGYYAIKFNKGWVQGFCPKLITIERYPYLGPYKSKLELKQVLTNDKSY